MIWCFVVVYNVAIVARGHGGVFYADTLTLLKLLNYFLNLALVVPGFAYNVLQRNNTTNKNIFLYVGWHAWSLFQDDRCCSQIFFYDKYWHLLVGHWRIWFGPWQTDGRRGRSLAVAECSFPAAEACSSLAAGSLQTKQ